jgi:hypothetical protein
MAAGAVVAFAGVLCACGEHLPRPTYVPQQTEALASVQYPPPPARVEFVPPQPMTGAVWIDGEWVWRGKKWAWNVGRWVNPPRSARYAPWALVVDREGTFFYAPGGWRDEEGHPEPDPPALSEARLSPGEIEDPEGKAENTGRTIRPQH